MNPVCIRPPPWRCVLNNQLKFHFQKSLQMKKSLTDAPEALLEPVKNTNYLKTNMMETKTTDNPTEPILRESCVIYRSHYEAAQVLPPEERLALYEATFQYGLNGIAPAGLSAVAQALFTCVKPLLDANNKKYLNALKGAKYGYLGAEHGKKGGRPPKETGGK